MAKLTKIQVGFENRASAQNTCSQCTHFDGCHGCSVVEGDVNASGWCKEFKMNFENPLIEFFDYAKHLADKD